MIKLFFYFLTLLTFLSDIGIANAAYTDNEISSSNIIGTNTLDISLKDTDNLNLTVPLFNNLQLSPTAEINQTLKIKKEGNLDFKYKLELINLTGNNTLCSGLDLELFQDSNLVYSSNLIGIKNQSFTISDSLDALQFKVSIPTDSSLQNKNCGFDIKFTAWQSNLSQGEGYSDTETTLTNSVYTLGWTPYVLAVTPGAVLGEKYVSGSDIEVTWEATSTGNLPDNSLFVQLSYSEDGGANFVEFAFLPFNTGSYTWTTPDNLISEQVLIKVLAFNFDPGGPFLGFDESLQFSVAPEFTSRDVVINEVFWSGSTQSTADEWVELYNTTGASVDLTGWKLAGAGAGSDSISLSGTLGSGEYMLISNYPTSGSAISDSISSNLVDISLNLDNSGEILKLFDLHENLIDTTPSGSWAAGENLTLNRSMERNANPGDGSDTANWHSCIDAVCNDSTYWDTNDGDDYGTPKLLNHSDNDPSSFANSTKGIEDSSLLDKVNDVEETALDPEPELKVSPDDKGDVEDTEDGKIEPEIKGEEEVITETEALENVSKEGTTDLKTELLPEESRLENTEEIVELMEKETIKEVTDSEDVDDKDSENDDSNEQIDLEQDEEV